MSYRTFSALLPALLLALGLALFQAPAMADETAMETGDHQSADTPVQDPHRWGD